MKYQDGEQVQVETFNRQVPQKIKKPQQFDQYLKANGIKTSYSVRKTNVKYKNKTRYIYLSFRCTIKGCHSEFTYRKSRKSNKDNLNITSVIDNDQEQNDNLVKEENNEPVKEEQEISQTQQKLNRMDRQEQKQFEEYYNLGKQHYGHNHQKTIQPIETIEKKQITLKQTYERLTKFREQLKQQKLRLFQDPNDPQANFKIPLLSKLLKDLAKTKLNLLNKQKKRLGGFSGVLEMFAYFDKNNFKYRTSPQMDKQQEQEIKLKGDFVMPRVTTFSNFKFVQNFKKFGQKVRMVQANNFCYFQKTGFIKSNQPIISRFCHSCMFVGQDSSLEYVPFAISFFFQKSVEIYQQIVKQFLEIISPESLPQTITTGLNQKLVLAIQKVIGQKNLNLAHIYDAQELRRYIKKGCQFNFLSKYLIKAIQTRSQYQCDLILNSLMQTEEILEDSSLQKARAFFAQEKFTEFKKWVLENRRKIFFTKIPPFFCGFNKPINSSKFFKKIGFNSKKSYQFKTNFLDAVMRLVHNIHRLISSNQQADTNITEQRNPDWEHISCFFRIPILQQCQTYLIDKTFEIVLENYVKSLQIDAICDTLYQPQAFQQFQTKRYIIKQPNQLKQSQGFIPFYVTFKVDKWQCSCGQSFKTGIPCPHELILIIKSNHALADYIHTRWVRHQHNYQIIKMDQKNKLSKNYQQIDDSFQDQQYTSTFPEN